MSSFTQVAKQAAIESGRHIRTIYYRLERLNLEQRADDAIFQQFYESIEENVITGLMQFYPDHAYYANFHPGKVRDSRFAWYVSLSGAENFRQIDPHFSISVAFEMDGELQSAVIYNPITNKIVLEASKGDGVLCEDEEQRVRLGKSDGKIENAALLTAVVPHDQEIARFGTMLRHARMQRVLGDFAQDCALVIKGVYSAYYAPSYDLATLKAVQLIAKEAGLLVTDYRGNEDVTASGTVVVTHPKLLKELLRALQL